jgi:hypothetical protein
MTSVSASVASVSDFIEAARELECDDDKERFEQAKEDREGEAQKAKLSGGPHGLDAAHVILAVEVAYPLPKLEAAVRLFLQDERPRCGKGLSIAIGIKVLPGENPRFFPKEIASISEHAFYPPSIFRRERGAMLACRCLSAVSAQRAKADDPEWYASCRPAPSHLFAAVQSTTICGGLREA